MYGSLSLSLYIYIYICMCIYIYIYIYIYIQSRLTHRPEESNPATHKSDASARPQSAKHAI